MGFGDPDAELVLIGLAPAAQGANRTGRVFTGDRSARFLVSALYQEGFANQPSSESREDGLRYRGTYLSLAVRCVPPGNRPTPREVHRCRPYLVEELSLLPRVRVLLPLGRIAYDQLRWAAEALYGRSGHFPPFAHGLRHPIGPGAPVVWASYHPSPRNVQTGLLSESTFRKVLRDLKQDLLGVYRPPTSVAGRGPLEGGPASTRGWANL
jgi:uracil-DNA glycosylase family 4